MEPLTAVIAVALAQGLVQIGSKLIDVGVDTALEPGKERLKRWFEFGEIVG